MKQTESYLFGRIVSLDAWKIKRNCGRTLFNHSILTMNIHKRDRNREMEYQPCKLHLQLDLLNAITISCDSNQSKSHFSSFIFFSLLFDKRVEILSLTMMMIDYFCDPNTKQKNIFFTKICLYFLLLLFYIQLNSFNCITNQIATFLLKF